MVINTHIHTKEGSDGETKLENIINEVARLEYLTIGIADHYGETSFDCPHKIYWKLSEDKIKKINEKRKKHGKTGINYIGLDRYFGFIDHALKKTISSVNVLSGISIDVFANQQPLFNDGKGGYLKGRLNQRHYGLTLDFITFENIQTNKHSESFTLKDYKNNLNLLKTVVGSVMEKEPLTQKVKYGDKAMILSGTDFMKVYGLDDEGNMNIFMDIMKEAATHDGGCYIELNHNGRNARASTNPKKEPDYFFKHMPADVLKRLGGMGIKFTLGNDYHGNVVGTDTTGNEIRERINGGIGYALDFIKENDLLEYIGAPKSNNTEIQKKIRIKLNNLDKARKDYNQKNGTSKSSTHNKTKVQRDVISNQQKNTGTIDSIVETAPASTIIPDLVGCSASIPRITKPNGEVDSEKGIKDYIQIIQGVHELVVNLHNEYKRIAKGVPKFEDAKELDIKYDLVSSKIKELDKIPGIKKIKGGTEVVPELNAQYKLAKLEFNAMKNGVRKKLKTVKRDYESNKDEIATFIDTLIDERNQQKVANAIYDIRQHGGYIDDEVIEYFADLEQQASNYEKLMPVFIANNTRGAEMLLETAKFRGNYAIALMINSDNSNDNNQTYINMMLDVYQFLKDKGEMLPRDTIEENKEQINKTASLIMTNLGNFCKNVIDNQEHANIFYQKANQ